MAKPQTPDVIFQPIAYQGFQRGVNQVVNIIRPTLGPCPRLVAVSRAHRIEMPELLDNGGIIARRIIQLANRDEDMGAMFIRHVLWRIHEEVGDGTATAAVMFQAIYNQGVRYIVAGGNVMQIRRHLEAGMQVVMDELPRMSRPLTGKAQLTQIAESICYDPPLASMLGEIFDVIGEYGGLDIKSGRGRELEREYIEGAHWEGGLLSRAMVADQIKQTTRMENAAILVSDLDIDEPRQLALVLDTVLLAQIQTLVIVANSLSDHVLTMLLANQRTSALRTIAVKVPGSRVDERAAALEDLAILTGGRPLLRAAGDALDRVALHDLGQARRVWATPSAWGLIGGKGDPRVLRTHVANLRAAYGGVEEPNGRHELQQRIGKLLGGSVTLSVGGATDSEIMMRKELAQRTAMALRLALMNGVLPGGGVALLACRPALQCLFDQSTDGNERTAYQMLITALEAPIRTILTNMHADVGAIMGEISRAGIGYGFDARSGQVIEMIKAGVFDIAGVQKAAVRSAITSAALALTIDVLVHSKNPEIVTTP